jgi:hypothetical protein
MNVHICVYSVSTVHLCERLFASLLSSKLEGVILSIQNDLVLKERL